MNLLLKAIALSSIVLLITNAVYAQDKEVVAAAERYKGENAIVWSSSEHLRLRFEKGKLIGKSDVEREVLLLTDHAASMYNTDEVYHGFHHTLDEIEAVSLQPNGNGYKTIKAAQYKTTHVSEDNIFYDDSRQTEVTYANLTRYTRKRLTYSLLHPDVHFLLPFYFQSYMHVRSATYSVTVPKNVNISYRLVGLHQDKIKMTKEESRNEITYIWSVADMPKATKFDDAPSPAYSVPHLIVLVKDYQEPQTDETRRVLSSVKDLYHYYYAFIRDVNTKPNAEMTGIVDSLTKGVSEPREKAARIYKWVQDHMRYVAYEDSMGGYVPRPSAVVCSRRFGDCKDMTSVLVAMCRKAGLNASFAWIGTRDIPYSYEDLPSPMADNHMICMVRIDGNWIFMDGTARNMPFGMPPPALQGKEALVGIDSNSFEIIPVPILAAEKNTTIDSTALRINGNDAEGNVSAHFSGYGAYHFAAVMLYSSGSDRDKMLRSLNTRGSDNYMQQSSSFIPGKDDLRECGVTAKFSLPNYVRSIGGETYINLNLQRKYEDDYVDKSVRDVPIEYSYKQHQKEIVTLKIPDGYKVTYLPPDKADSDPGLWGYKLHYEQKGNEVVLVKDLLFNTILVKPGQFSVHNRLVEGLRNEYKESVVLSKSK